MPTLDPRVDEYIASAAPFAQPILRHVRKLVHKACPQVVETMKWSTPHFEHKGVLCNMPAFKTHCRFGFWKGSLIIPEKPGTEADASGMNRLGRLTRLEDLPPDKTLLAYIAEAVRLNEEGIKIASPPRAKERTALVMPDDLAKAFKANRTAAAAFEKLSYSHKKEYLEWITEAKRAETRSKRIATTLEWVSEGKPRHWKYANC